MKVNFFLIIKYRFYILGLKFSSFENVAGNEQGVTKYAVNEKFEDNEQFIQTREENLRLSLLKMTGVYAKSFIDVVKRH